MTWEYFEPFLVALAIGLLLGFERERSHARVLPAGSRTFALLSLAGAVAARIDPTVAAAGAVGVAALMATTYVRTSRDDPGATTEIAGVIAYLLGALAITHAAAAVALAVVVAVLLVSKDRIHRFVRDVVTEVEVEDAIKFFVVALVVLPLLPDRALGPYGVLNPSKVWTLVVLLTGIGWFGYIGVRALGPRRGLVVTGLAGGFVSASATTATMARMSRGRDDLRGPLASALAASVATFLQLLLVIGFVDAEVLRRLWPAVVIGAVTLTAVAVFVYRSGRGSATAVSAEADGDVPAEPAAKDRPFALRPALILAAVLTGALLLSRWISDVLGEQGLALAAAATGLADAHAGALAAATMSASGAATVDGALIAIGAALGTNLVVKTVLAFTGGGARFGLRFVAWMAVPTVLFAVALVLTIELG